ncbi:MAG: hypothetical protein DRP12_01155 [Candidatus Aenigmatarchaeota archaeon]|nr:MAG: hypothetical protein DRP12_01155 [Candidatus Aenigmarchaeota archaeon]
MTIKLSTEEFRNIVAFRKVTKIHPIDCLTNGNCVYFLVDAKKLGAAIGKNGSNIRMLSRITNKQVQLLGLEEELEKTLKLLLPSLKAVEENGNQVTAFIQYPISGKRFQVIKEVVKRHFKKELKLMRY